MEIYLRMIMSFATIGAVADVQEDLHKGWR